MGAGVSGPLYIQRKYYGEASSLSLWGSMVELQVPHVHKRGPYIELFPSLVAYSVNEGPPLAVVSGDITLNSLRVFIREALPQCDQGGIECIIVDDNGNLVYDRELFNFNGKASFFGRTTDRLRAIVSNLTSLATKRQCTELFNVQLTARRFHSVSGCPARVWAGFIMMPLLLPLLFHSWILPMTR